MVVLTHDEWAWEEQAVQREVGERLKALGVPLLTFWGSTLIHLADLPFPVSHLPPVYTQFRLAVEKQWKVRDWRDFTPDGPLLPLPEGFADECGKVPTMGELGYEEGKADPAWEPTIDARSVVQWKGGETEAMKRVTEYIWGTDSMRTYKSTRNELMGKNSSSKLSPFLCQGSLSALYLYAEIQRYEKERLKNDSTYFLVFEVLWRDYFRYYCLFNSRRMFFPYGVKGRQLVLRQRDLIQPEWNDDPQLIEAWKQGRTGYPFIDANMRELMRSGWMSNRGRQVVASFLIKDMKMDWRIGAEWFESHLLDYDVGSNWANWAYLAGVGGDPRNARYFAVAKQQAMYDPKGEFVGLWIPALKKMRGGGRDGAGKQHQQPSIIDSLKQVHLNQQSQPQPQGHDEEKAGGGSEGDSADVEMDVEEMYDCQPVVRLLHEPKRGRTGSFCSTKSRSGGASAWATTRAWRRSTTRASRTRSSVRGDRGMGMDRGEGDGGQHSRREGVVGGDRGARRGEGGRGGRPR